MTKFAHVVIIGSESAGNNSVALTSQTNSSVAIYGVSTSGTGVKAVASGDINPALQAILNNSVTNKISPVFVVSKSCTATPTTGMGAGIVFRLESTTTDEIDVAQVGASWTVATHASRAAALTFSVANSAGTITERSRITSAGVNLFGMTAPLWSSAAGDIENSNNLYTGNAQFTKATSVALNLVPTNAGSAIYNYQIGVGGAGDFTGAFYIYDVWTSPTVRFLIKSDGNVGVGTTTPSAKLDVAGGYIRARDDNSNNAPTSGKGLEFLATGGVGYIVSWNRDTSAGQQLQLTGSPVNIAGGQTVLQINSTQVLTTRRTGWGAPTGTPTRTTFATSTVTLSQLAERVKALIDDLTTHGVIGA